MPFVGQAEGKGVYGRYHSVFSNFANLNFPLLSWGGCIAYPWEGAMRRPDSRMGEKLESPMPFLFPYTLCLIGRGRESG